MATIGELLPEQQKLLRNGEEIPRRILDNHWDEFINKIVSIKQYGEIETPYENRIARLVEFKSDGRCRFQRKNGSKFVVHIDDIESLVLFLSKNYNEN